ncbi:MAG: PhoH family protein, partial [Pseudomonadota bacterium]
MPLPPAPTKRAALLSTEAFDAPARSPSKAARKTDQAEPAHKTPALDLFDSRSTGGEAEHPVAYEVKQTARPGSTGTGSYHKESAQPARPQPAPKAKKPKHTGPTKL